MLSETYADRISNDWFWREKELRQLDARLLRSKADIEMKSSILISYSHWEAHFKFCALQLLEFIDDGVRRKVFRWTDVRADVRTRILFCSYRRSSIKGQSQETFISYLNALHDDRFSEALKAKDEIIMVDDNLSCARAEAICRNLGLDHSWCSLKKIIIDERILEHRNAIAHGEKRLRSGDEMNLQAPEMVGVVDEVKHLIRETKNRFGNAIVQREFLDPSPSTVRSAR